MVIQSLLSYLLIIVILLFLAMRASQRVKIQFLKRKHLKYMPFEMWLAFIVFACFLGMRYDVGVDHLLYLERYLTGQGLEYNKYGIGYKTILQICTWLNLHAVAFFAILAFIQISFFFYAFKDDYYIYPFLLLFLFVNGDVGSWMNIIRCALAMCIWTYSISFLIEKRWLIYFALCLLAFCFHRSAIILFPAYFILKNGKDYFDNIWLQYAILLICICIRIGFASFIYQAEGMVSFYQQMIGGEEELYSNYDLANLITEKAEVGTGLAFYAKTIVWIFIIAISPQIKKFYPNTFFVVLYNIFFFGLAISYLFPTGTISLSRPFRYFFTFQTVMLAYSVYYLYRTKRRFFAIIIIGLFVGIFVMSQITATTDSHKLYQYFFQHDINYYPQ